MTRLEPASAAAAGICWLARQPGLPNIATLRIAVSTRHQVTCAWCDYDLPALLRLIEEALSDELECKRFERLPRSEQRRLVDAAQGSVLA